MKLSILTGLLAPALLASAAASQTILAVRPLPFTGIPRILPLPVMHLPLTPVNLPSPLRMPRAELSMIPLAPAPRLAATIDVAGLAAEAPRGLPAISMDGSQELPFVFRRYQQVERHLGTAAPAVERPAKAPAARPAGPAPLPKVVPQKKHRDLERIFDGRSLTLPEDDLERELGLR
ncbi:MAG: hypothetical protein SF051_01105 [Elusimicrobiota bacterium]|nr:hypothetical protein [Elusimicrobiota bacterium]